MSILSSKKTIFYLKHSSIEVFFRGGTKTKKIAFSANALADQEILDRKAFEKELLAGITGIKKQEVVIILSDEILYYLKTPKIEDFNIQDFLDLTPFEESGVAKKVVPKDKEYYVVIANQEYFAIVKRTIERFGFRVNAIIPFIAGSNSSQDVSYEALNNRANNSKLISNGNFLNQTKYDRTLSIHELIPEKKVDTEVDEEEKPISMKQYALLGISIVVLIVSGVFAYFQMQTPAENNEASVTPKPSVNVTKAESTESLASSSGKLKREDLSVQILNGTGVAGQAGVVKSQLDEIGFIDSVTDNATGTPSDNTTVSFSVEVSDGFQAEIIDVLESVFVNVVPITNQNTSEYDVIIITGKTL